MSNIQLAINWAINACNAPNIGYSQAYRNQQTVGGITYYDCASFVWYALKAAGFNVEAAYKTATGNAYSGNAIIVDANFDRWMRAMGFTPYNPAVEAWQRGDVMAVIGSHTEMCYDPDNFYCMGAHTDSRPLSEQVSISNYSTRSYWGVAYRYKQATWHAKPRGAYARNSAEALDNATLIYGTLAARGWTVNAVSALLGNIDGEGGYNPWRWESDVIQSAYGTSGYGLVQFTPGTKYIQAAAAKALADYAPNYSGATGANAHDGNAQIIFIDEHADYYATASYPLSYAEFKASTDTPEYLTKAWIYNYERPLDPSASLASRIAAANYWYEVLSGITPPTPGGRFPFGLQRKLWRGGNKLYCNDTYEFNPPYTAEQVQWANGRFNPVGVKVDSAVLAYYERAFFDRLTYFMEILGAPDIWDKNYMYYSMFRYGYVGVVDAVGRNGERFGEIPQFGTLGGIGLFLQPTRLSVVNKFIDMPLLKINEECGILQLTNDYRGIWDIIRRYAIKMALVDKTFDMSLINSRVSTFVFAKTKEAALTLKAAEDKAQAGEPMVIFDKEILCPDDPDTMKDPFVTWDRDVRNTFIAPELADLHRSIMNEFDSEIGIPNANLQKKERMTENEIDENNGETYSRITNWIDTFNRTAAVGCNKLYGLNIHARIRGEIDVSNNNIAKSDDME